MDQNTSAILTESGTNELEIIEFHLEKQLPEGGTKRCYYGINVAKVREVIRVPETTDYPNAQPHMIGVFSSREILTPLVDLAGWLEIPKASGVESKYVIVTDFNRMTNGFLIDSVSRIHRISWNDVESPSQFLEAGEQDCVVAVVRKEGRLIMILDFEKIIADINPELSMEKYDVTVDKSVNLNQKMVTKRNAKTVMVVDDSAFIRSLIQDTLSSSGYNIIACKDGGEAYEKLMSIKASADDEGVAVSELINAVVTDVEMPRMDGMHLVKRLRDMEVFRKTPIIMFSSLMSDDNRHKAMSLGANDTITKPEIGKMVSMMDKYIFEMD
ncbi:chemotaxis protein [Vibrio quintilis]|uniref:Chemotaxis protein CheV n=1 Tax=Vibrio quintilis TaxID=1117707 RepID=A0A1M7YU82_9VIBR|nr:chemotaxis protein [Vibrio quintilis]SHO56162.1 Chemotaxis protein CheV [Vibrio quintilis]